MQDNTNHESALKVNEGIEQPPSVNEDAVSKYKNKQKYLPSVAELSKGILKGDRTMLSRAITLIESSLPQHQILAQEVIEQCLPHSGKSIRIGITGVPGAGKSTFIESIGKHLTSLGKKIAVLAIDPSSERSKGSILGDKTRMEELAVDANAFIRPSPSAGTLGGVARKTRESIILCEAAGFDVIFIETVGVGQSETLVHSMVDFFLLLMIAGAGDELQGIKRGIMEMADAIVVNKADGDNIQRAQMARSQYANALHLFSPISSGWIPLVETCSAYTKDGIDDVWKMICNYEKLVVENGYFEQNRKHQSEYRMFETINEMLKVSFYSDKEIEKLIPEVTKELLENKISSYVAANKLMDKYYKDIQNREI
ncbi:MAG: methylmalonyl Co-A mutase-associated GTPase MeaB [Bacteroidota bacterium]